MRAPRNGERFQVWHESDVFHVGRCLLTVEDNGELRWIVRAEEGGRWTLSLRSLRDRLLDGVQYWGTRTGGPHRR